MNEFNSSADKVADEAKNAAGAAIDSGRAYAKDAVDSAGARINSLKSQWDHTCDYVTKAIHDEPVKAVIVTAVVSSLLTALLSAAIANEDRHFRIRR